MTGFWENRPTLVTGGSGFVGSWLIKSLLAQQAQVVCILRDWVGESDLIAHLPRIRVVRGDIRNQALVERTLGEYEIDTVFHLAAQAVVGIANRNPISTFESNIRGTWTLLEACRRSPAVKQIVVASSDKAYGCHERLPYTEDTPLKGRYPYDVSKSCADLIAGSYAVTYGLPVLVSRCANLYGGGDLNWNRLVPGTIRSALRGERPMIRSDGNPRRDYLYVEDGVAGYLALAERLYAQPDLAGRAFNFGHRAPVTVVDFVGQILRACGREDLEPDVRAEARHEIEDQYLDRTRAEKILGWAPRFEQGDALTRTVLWYRAFLSERGWNEPQVPVV